jgi:hypothetical protein
MVKSMTIDNRNNIWCDVYGGHVVFDRNSKIDSTKFQEESDFSIGQAKDNKIRFGTGNGVFINR